MATYFHGNSEIQPDGLQTLYLMNPYVGYSDTSQPPTQPPNMAFLNSTGTPLNPANLSQSEQTQNHHFVGIPLQPIPTTPSSSSQHNPNPSSSSSQHEISTFHGFIPRVPYNLWSSIDHQITSPSVNNSVSATDYPTQLGLRRSSQQGLSLSLSPQPPAYGTYRSESDIPAPSSAPVISPAARGGDEMRASGGSSSSVVSANENSNTHSVVMGSKYLKVAQELLDEVVNVGNSIKNELSKENKKGEIKNKEMNSYNGGEGSSTIGGDSSERKETELSTIERQEIQMKRAKLLTMLDEVEQRYTQYHQQMQIVVNSFEQSAGFSSAKSYTSLALQTISKQFRCLKDAILAQLRTTSKNLGEEDALGGGKHRLVDHQLRQQRALQQLGMIQQNAWRPQRGLPERSVSTLRAWLFEHFLHPYPKDADKLMLAKQTGLTRSQVSNWFINARVRLWKPMVEEMYMEETKGQVQNGLEDESRKTKFHEELSSKRNENTLNEVDQTENPNTKQDKPLDSNIPRSTIDETIRTQSGFFLAGSSNGEEIVQRSAKKSRNTALQNSPSNDESVDMEMKPDETERKLHMNFGNERQNRDGYSFITDAASNGGEFGAYQQMDEIERFGPEQFAPPRFSNGVSLTLGLPHCENLSLSSTQQTYISNHNIQIGRQIEIGDANEAYENINIQNRKRFANQLLPDFVA